jgi:uncharacterized protein (DUF697 family)
MNRRKLPRVIVRARDDEAGSPVPGNQRSAPLTNTEVSAAGPPVLALISTALPEPEPSSASARPIASGPKSRADVARRARALKIVNRHAGYSAVGGIMPLPIANFAGVTAVILRMVKVLSNHYGVPFEHDRARAIVVALVVGAMPTGLGAVTSSALLYVVPGSAFVGLAVSSFSAVACTRSIGRIFVEHFENGATLADFPTT